MTLVQLTPTPTPDGYYEATRAFLKKFGKMPHQPAAESDEEHLKRMQHALETNNPAGLIPPKDLILD